MSGFIIEDRNGPMPNYLTKDRAHCVGSPQGGFASDINLAFEFTTKDEALAYIKHWFPGYQLSPMARK